MVGVCGERVCVGTRWCVCVCVCESVCVREGAGKVKGHRRKEMHGGFLVSVRNKLTHLGLILYLFVQGII